MRLTRQILCLTLASVLALLCAPLTAQEADTGPPSPHQLRQQLLPEYQRLQGDLEFQALRRQLHGNMENRTIVDRYLTYLPISPLDLLEIDMQQRRYEYAIPKFVAQWHRRWIELHEEKARTFYGDHYVDGVTSWSTQIDGDVKEPTDNTKMVIPGVNRNMAFNYPIPPDEYQGEIQLAVNPNNPDQIVAAANTWDNAKGLCTSTTQAIFFSSDGGVNWGYTCAPEDNAYASLNCANAVVGSDPAVAWNATNEVFLEYMLICTDSFDGRFAIVVASSVNGGLTWAGRGVVANSWGTANQVVEDKEFLAIDTHSASPFADRMYTCWDRDNNEKFAFSTDGGANWTEVDLPTPTGGGFDLGCDIAVENNGTVHVAFNTLTCPAGGLCNNERMFYTRSLDGGLTWSTPGLVHDFNLVGFSGANCPDAQDNRCVFPFGTIAVDNSGGPCNGHLYTTFTDFNSGDVNDSDVWIARSTNSGGSWSAPVRVNDGGLANRVQFHPYMEVDPTNGDLVVAWHDARNDSGNDAVDYFLGRSIDCGLSFEPNIQISQASNEFSNNTVSSSNDNTADNSARNPNQYGEYLGLDALNGKAYVAWTDTRQFFPNFSNAWQKENVGFSVVDFFSFTLEFRSKAAQDGWVKESTENSNIGGSKDANETLRVGDNVKDRQFKSILSFDTSTIPPGASIQSVRLRLRRGSVTGTNPFTLLGSLHADVSSGGFNGDSKLQNGDFQAAATATQVCTLPSVNTDGEWTDCTFNAAGLAAVSTTGRTQVRLYFTTDDDDDRSADYISFNSGGNPNPDKRPELIVTYQ